MSIQTEDAREYESATLTLPFRVGNWVQQQSEVTVNSDGIQSLWATYYRLDGRDVTHELCICKNPNSGDFTCKLHEVTGYAQDVARRTRTKESIAYDGFSTWADCREQILALMEQDEVAP